MKEAAERVIELTENDKTRFWAKVDKSVKPDGCWLWTASKNKTGYGNFHFGRKTNLSHRIAWVLTHGQIPHDGSHHGICVCHRCDVPACCNPAHLFLGTQADNMRDQVEKGRTAAGDANGLRLHPEMVARGEENGNAKLTAKKVIELRELYASEAMLLRQLATQFNISITLTSLIINRKRWQHV